MVKTKQSSCLPTKSDKEEERLKYTIRDIVSACSALLLEKKDTYKCMHLTDPQTSALAPVQTGMLDTRTM